MTKKDIISKKPKYSDYTIKNVAGNRVVSVVITDWELENC